MRCFQFIKRLFPIILETSKEITEEINIKIKELKQRLFVKEKEKTGNIMNMLRKELQNFETFKTNIIVMNFESLALEDKKKFDDISAFFEERNCFYL